MPPGYSVNCGTLSQLDNRQDAEDNVMTRAIILMLLLICIGGAYARRDATPSSSSIATSRPVTGPFSPTELAAFKALRPVDTHTHVLQSDQAFYAMLKKLNIHILNIMLVDDTDPESNNLEKETTEAWQVVNDDPQDITLCTTFDPFQFNRASFSQESNRKINSDFARGAVAVKIWKNVGMEIKDTNGKYLMPNNPVFEPIFIDIARHNKTLIAHLADPDTIWQAPTPSAPDYDYYMHNPRLYMYGRKGAPTKQEILEARDQILERNPELRVVGAHLGSMEADFSVLAHHLDRYPNFAVDIAARMPYVEMQPREKIIDFITRYQDRLIYGTDNEFYPGRDAAKTVMRWESRYSNDWRFFSTNDVISYRNRRVQGLDLPQSILRKLYHDNAVKWFPGMVGSSQ